MDERQWALANPFMWFVLLALGFAVAMIIREILVGASSSYVGLGLVIVGASMLAAAYLRVRTEGDHLVLTWVPIWQRKVELNAIESAAAVAYRFRDFGGWGIRLGRGTIAYSVWSKRAIRLRIQGAKRDLVFTTHQEDAWLNEFRLRGIAVDESSN